MFDSLDLGGSIKEFKKIGHSDFFHSTCRQSDPIKRLREHTFFNIKIYTT